MKKINNSSSRKADRIEKFGKDYEVMKMLKSIKTMCDNCPDRIFCEVPYTLKSCSGGEQSGR